MTEMRLNEKLAVILIGPPGSGKGTYGKKIAEEMGGMYLNTGDVLREKKGKDKRLAVIDKGSLIDDKTILDILQNFLEKVSSAPMVVLDGAIRTYFQSVAVVTHLKHMGYDPIITLELVLPREQCARRLLDRNHGRADDNAKVIHQRFTEYYEPLTKILQQLKHKTILTKVSTLGSIGEVHVRVRQELIAVLPVAK